jgi:di/tricarboxylate transporter
MLRKSSAPKGLLQRIASDKLLWLLLLVLPLLGRLNPLPLSQWPWLVDWPTLGTLSGLLMLTKGIELSGALQKIGHDMITRMHSERHLALFLVAASGILAMVLTNDVALFIVVPLTLGLHGMATNLPTVRLVVFEALAVNAGSTLTPIGNPQNLFLWHRSGTSFIEFTMAMAPLAGLMSGLLLLLTLGSFSGRRIETVEDLRTPAVRASTLAISLAMFPVFLYLIDRHQVGWALSLVFCGYLLTVREVPRRSDWSLILVFLLMFVDLRLLAGLDTIRNLIEASGQGGTSNFVAATAASQLISNVPATILLSDPHRDWRALAYGADVGGFGLMIGSLANLIALRLVGNRRAWIVFHGFSLPFLAVCGGLAYCLWFSR